MDENKNGLSEQQTQAQEYLQMGQTLLGAEKFQEAIAMFERSLQLDGMNKVAYLSQGIAYASAEKYGDAKKCFSRAVKIDKNFADAYFQLGNMAFIEEDFEEGIKNYNQAVFLGYHSEELYYNLGLVYEEREEYAEAIRNYSKAISMDERNPVYMIRKASLQIFMNKLEEALQTLEKLRIQCPESFDGYHLTAAAYTMLGEYEKADEILKYAQELFPDDKDILFDRMRVLVTEGKEEEALKMLETAKEMECTIGEKKEILSNEGQIYAQREDLEKAAGKFSEALALGEEDDADAEIRYFLMNCYLIMKDYESLLKVARAVDRKKTENAFQLCGVYFECLALKLLESAEFEAACENAVKYYRNISMNDPVRIDAYLFRAMCYKELKNYQKALESVEYVLLLQPENGQLHQIKGNILSEMPGKEAEAKEEYAQARRLGVDSEWLGGR